MSNLCVEVLNDNVRKEVEMRFQHHIVGYIVLNGKMIINSGQNESCHVIFQDIVPKFSWKKRGNPQNTCNEGFLVSQSIWG